MDKLLVSVRLRRRVVNAYLHTFTPSEHEIHFINALVGDSELLDCTSMSRRLVSTPNNDTDVD